MRLTTALRILRRDLVRYLRNPGRTALLFAIPLMMAAIFALVFGGGSDDGGITIRVLLWVRTTACSAGCSRGPRTARSPKAASRWCRSGPRASR